MDQIHFCQRCGSGVAEQLHQDRMRPVCTSCGAVVFLDRRDTEPGIGRWTFPAGFVDRGEGVEEAAVREMEEESGLKVRISGLLGVYSKAGEAIVLIVYSGDVIGGTLAAGPEAQEAGLFDSRDMPPLAFERDTAIMADWMRRSGV